LQQQTLLQWSAIPRVTGDKKMKLTPQQEVFVDELVHGKGNIALVARAGTGKTSTIIEGAVAYATAFPDAEVTICAFAKPVQIEIDAKLKAGCYFAQHGLRSCALFLQGREGR
jgi:hypothetical protein